MIKIDWHKIAILLMTITIVLFGLGLYIAMILPPSPDPTLRDNYRIIFFHVPCAITSFIAFTITLISAIMFLRSQKLEWDLVSYSSAKAGFFLITAALISGSIWAKVAWGSYWNWDPRQTTVLILWFTYAAYLALRSSIDEEDIRAKACSVFAIFAYLTIPLTYLSTRILFSLHPTTIQLGIEIGLPLFMISISILFLYIAFVLIDVKIAKINLKLES
ncbi:MAG TPA: cytochrome C assembly protein [Archaeoglobus profundus]|nr:cytochrome C assembly protein [Archaeoglobus profundus]HIP58735.1 cytochrome C assembly protein [Archaeoglobus profundus]